MISSRSVDRRYNNADGPEKRGRKSVITNQQLKEMDRIIQEEGFEARKLSWLELGFEVGIEGVQSRTISHAMGNTMEYSKCIACQKKWCNKSLADARKAWAKAALRYRPNPESWHNVRFSDEVHWDLGSQGSIYITRKPGERYCKDCIQIRDERTENEKEMKKVHAWAAVGFNFKPNLTFYDISSNNNGKMAQQAYISQILEPVVKPWLEAGHRFVLEEDGDSGHGPGKQNVVRTWKEKHKLQYYFNCYASPDLSPIENAWQPPKQYVKKFPH